MAATNLKTLGLEYDPVGVIPEPYGIPTDPVDRKYQAEIAPKLNAAINYLRTASIFFDDALAEASIEMKKPPTREICIVLSRNDELDWPKRKGRLMLVRALDPLALLDIPYDAQAYGEFFIDCLEWMAQRLEIETDFPSLRMQEWIVRFRENGYAVDRSLKPQGVDGSKAKARIFGTMSCVSTALKVEISYRGKILFERTVWQESAPAWAVAFRPRNILVEDGRLKVRGIMRSDPVPEVSFSLDSLPEEFLETLT